MAQGKNMLELPLPIETETVAPEVLREELAQSYKVVKKLLPFMAKRCIPATPRNFRLFYDYISFANPEINKVLNELLEKEAEFHSQLTDRLYFFFYSSEFAEFQTQAITKVATNVMDVSSTVADSLQNARTHSGHFQKVLSDTAQQMAAMTSAEGLPPFLEGLMVETELALASEDRVISKLKEADATIASLKDELKNQTDLARVDELTKLNNRRHFILEAPRIIRESLAQGRSVSAIIFDLDLFKSINDTWGHNYGDKVLMVCADIIRSAARNTDLAVRLGGEEFLLLCANLGLSTAAKVADRVRQSIASTDIHIHGKSISVTVSAGVAEYVPGEELAALVDRADRALYKSKETGRNRVSVADEMLLSIPGANE